MRIKCELSVVRIKKESFVLPGVVVEMVASGHEKSLRARVRSHRLVFALHNKSFGVVLAPSLVVGLRHKVPNF